ncbi:MAG: peptide deformylase [Gammaproteobacteria bacterium]|nr:peptide deformylase [Gammaproteobacteria bacterium]
MAILDVLHIPDNRLRKIAHAISDIDDSIRELANDMLETMYAENGIGLAATQVNVQKRLVVMDLSTEQTDPKVLINPEILSSSGTEEMQEGCLSVPEIFETVERPETITVRYQNLKGESIEESVDGLYAVCIQHEIDHLNGRLFIDYLSPLKRNRILKKFEKQEKLQAARVS